MKYSIYTMIIIRIRMHITTALEKGEKHVEN
jgi:hypothetical protein